MRLPSTFAGSSTTMVTLSVIAGVGVAAFVGGAAILIAGAYGGSGATLSSGHIVGAPGPVAGSGLPVLAVGYGVYWLVRRHRRKADTGLPRGDLKD
jgi:hypothetical protein